MHQKSPFEYYKTSPEIIKLAVMYYVRLPLSLRQVEGILHERGIDVCHETIRYWWNKFGALFFKEIKRKRPGCHSNWRRHKDMIILGLHPGTVDSALSAPFQSGVKEGKLFTPEFSAQKLLEVIMSSSPADSGKCLAWDRQEIQP